MTMNNVTQLLDHVNGKMGGGSRLRDSRRSLRDVGGKWRKRINLVNRSYRKSTRPHATIAERSATICDWLDTTAHRSLV